MEIVAWFLTFTACLWVLWWMLSADARKFRKFEADVRSRIAISEQEFAANYFRCEQIPIDVAFRVRQVFGRFTGIPAEKILPDDDFQMFVQDNEEELMISLEQEFGLTIADSEAIKMRATVRSVSMVMANIVRGSLPM